MPDAFVPKTWIEEEDPLGPPADPDNNTPVDANALNDLEGRIDVGFSEAEENLVSMAAALEQVAASAATDAELEAERNTREAAVATITAAAAAAQSTAEGALSVTGGTMAGDIVLHGDATQNLHPVSKQQLTAAINAVVNGAPGLLDTLKEIADQLANDESAVAALTSAVAGKQPLDEDLTKLAALSTQAFGRSLLEVADAATGRTALALGTAATKDAGATGEAGKLLKTDDAGLATDIASKLYVPALKVPARAQRTVIQQFQAGHEYTRSSGTGTLSDDVTDYVRGNQSLKFVTAGDGAVNNVQKLSIPATDFTGKSFAGWAKVEGLENVADFSAYLSSDDFSSNNHHYPLLAAAQLFAVDGEWFPFVINWGDLAANGAQGALDRTKVKSLKFRMQDKNGKPVTFHINEAATVPDPTTAVLMFWFDDACRSTYTIARRWMDPYGFRGAIPVIADLIAEVGGNYMSFAELKFMQDVSGFDVCAHAGTVANHNAGYGTLPDATVEAEFRLIKEFLIQLGCKARDLFAWPKGSFTASQMPLVRKYFSAARGTSGGKGGASGPHEVFPPADPHRLRAWLVTNTTTKAEVEAALTQAIASKSRLSIVFHRIVATGAAASTEMNESVFKEVMAAVAASGITVKTPTEDLAT